MSKRINITLPERTLAVLDRVAPKGDSSRFVSAAVLRCVETKGKQRLRQELKAGYLANAHENLRIAAEWFPCEEKAWQKSRIGQGARNTR
jgi:CopG family transcriptional regulator/antitoxin EndoAI